MIDFFLFGYLVSFISVILTTILFFSLLIHNTRNKKSLNTIFSLSKDLETEEKLNKNRFHYFIPFYGLFEFLVFVYNIYFYFKSDSILDYLYKSNIDSTLFK